MVDHEKRQATTRQMIATASGTFRSTRQDRYREMRARYMLKSAHFVATKEHYSEEIDQNQKKILLLRKTISQGMLELTKSKSNVLKPHDEHLIITDSIKNLRDNFILWAAHYTDQTAETSIGIKFSHVAKLILDFDSLLHSRQKLVNQINMRITALKASTINNGLDRVKRSAIQKLRVLGCSFAKMKEKTQAARDVNMQYRQIVNTLTEQTQQYPVVIESLEKELARMEDVYKKDFVFISEKAGEYLQKVLKEKKNIERKTVISCAVHRRILIERNKQLWKLKKQMGESKEIRRLMHQALEIDDALMCNTFVLNDAAERRWNLAMEQEIQTEELMNLQFIADDMKPTFNIPIEDCVKKIILQTKRMKQFRKLYETTYKKLIQKSKILDELSAFSMEVNGNYLSSQQFQEGKIQNRTEAIREVTGVVHQKTKKLGTIGKHVKNTVAEMACLCDKFQHWAEVQQIITGYNWRSPNFMDFRTAPLTPEGIDPVEIFEYFSGFKENYFRVVSDILYNIEKFYPVFEEADEKYKVKICQLVLNQSKSDRTTNYLVNLRARYTRLPDDTHTHTDDDVNMQDIEVDSDEGENHKEDSEDVINARSNSTQEYKNRLQIKKLAQHLILMAKDKRRVAKYPQ